MSKSQIISAFISIIVLAALSVVLAWPGSFGMFGGLDYKLGLDLQGGTALTYQGKLDRVAPEDREDAMAGVRDVVERRVNTFGVSEPSIRISGEDRLIVELPGVTEIEQAVNLIGQTPLLEFREEDPDFQLPEDPNALEGVDPYSIFKPTKLTGAYLQRAEVTFSSQTSGVNEPQISLYFNSEGADLFKDVTERNLGRRVAIFLDGELVVAPFVQSVITDGRAVITGSYSIEQAREEATRLNSGALPVPIELLSQRNIGPTLGKISVAKSLSAGVIGLLAVALFMMAYYRLPGLIAALALLIYVSISLSIFQLLNITLTTASIAGFILSIGVAIDANILIFERTKEELRRGKEFLTSVEEGFKRAWPSIRDSNLSSLITAAVLITGASFVRGFAITLGVGILVSMFTAITVTRSLLMVLTLNKSFNKPETFGVKPDHNV